jgi:ferrous iron transport protein A
MHDLNRATAQAPLGAAPVGESGRAATRLSEARPGDRGTILDVRAGTRTHDHGVALDELHRCLLEFGFVEGARIEVLHEGAIRRDPIAVRLDDMRVALRRRDAEDIWVALDAE